MYTEITCEPEIPYLPVFMCTYQVRGYGLYCCNEKVYGMVELLKYLDVHLIHTREVSYTTVPGKVILRGWVTIITVPWDHTRGQIPYE